jgi:hypothetical protein
MLRPLTIHAIVIELETVNGLNALNGLNGKLRFIFLYTP